MERWPDVITAEFWSFTFMHAVLLHNCTPHPGETTTPYTLFTDEDPPASSHDFKVFGSPVYVLDSALQSGNLGPGKWKNRCHQGIYIGHSLHHASNVILVYNPKTRLVSSKYHVVHDKNFDTVQINKSKDEAQAELDKMLDELFVTACWQHANAYTDCDGPSTSHYYFDNSWDLAYEQALSGNFSNEESATFPDIMLQHLQVMVSHFEMQSNTVPYSSRSNDMIDFATMQSIINKRNITFDGVSIDSIFNSDNPIAFATTSTKNNPDILSQAQMLKAPDVDLFLASQQPEIQGLCNADVFEFHCMSNLPPGAHLLNAIWSYQ
jgi:hypothetical protein